MLAVLFAATFSLGACGLPYECASDVHANGNRMSWQLLTDDQHVGVYQIAHWRIEHPDGSVVERLAYLTRPDDRPPYYRMFEQRRVRSWRTLWLGHRLRWQEYRRGSPAHVSQCNELARILGLVQFMRETATSKSLPES